MLGFLLIHLIVLHRQSRAAMLGAYGGAAVAGVLCAALGGRAAPLLVVALLAAVFLLLAFFELRVVARQSGPRMAAR